MLERSFEDAQLTINGQDFGSFDGSAQWDESGVLDRLTIKAAVRGKAPLVIDRAELMKQRFNLQKTYDGDFIGLLHRESQFLMRWLLFTTLEEFLSDAFIDDIDEMRNTILEAAE